MNSLPTRAIRLKTANDGLADKTHKLQDAVAHLHDANQGLTAAKSQEEQHRKKAEKLNVSLKTALGEAQKARDDEKQALEKTEAALALNTMLLAQSRFREGRASLAEETLDEVSNEFRHQVFWRDVQGQLEGSYATLYGHLARLIA